MDIKNKKVYVIAPENKPVFGQCIDLVRIGDGWPLNMNPRKIEEAPPHILIGQDIGRILFQAEAVIFGGTFFQSRRGMIAYIVASAAGLPLYRETSERLYADTDYVAEARRLVLGDRNQSYGHPFHDFQRQCEIVKAIGVSDSDEPEDVALRMMAVKVSREFNREKRDNLVDLAGYVLCWKMVKEFRAKNRIDTDKQSELFSG